MDCDSKTITNGVRDGGTRAAPDSQYEADLSSDGLTSLAGLPLYFDLIKASGVGAAIQRHVRAAGGQGWLDIQMALAVIFLNLAGGDCVEDIERLERDGGFSAILRRDREGFAVARGTAVAEEPVASRARAGDALAVGAVELVGAVS